LIPTGNERCTGWWVFAVDNWEQTGAKFRSQMGFQWILCVFLLSFMASAETSGFPAAMLFPVNIFEKLRRILEGLE
jgi:hypothetical protein